MALKFFDEPSSSSGQLPFLDDYVKSNQNNKQKQFSVCEIRRVKSDKGYLVLTNKFSCFIWKNSAIAKQIVEALDHYVKTAKGFDLVVFLPDPKKADFRLAADFDAPTTWFASKNGYTTLESESSSQEEIQGGNPFIPD